LGITTGEYWEETRRFVEADAEIGVAVLLFIGGVFLLFYELWMISILLWIAAILLAWDGSTKRERIKHIVWTKQALREYDVSKDGTKKIILNKSDDKSEIFTKPHLKIIPEDKEENNDKQQEILNLLKELDKRLIEGKISEVKYDDLKEKYENELNKFNSK
jgi:hypothetical protein